MRKLGNYQFSLKRDPKLGSKPSFIFLIVGYIFVLGLYNIIGGRVRKEKEDEKEEKKGGGGVEEEEKEEREEVVMVISIIMVTNEHLRSARLCVKHFI